MGEGCCAPPLPIRIVRLAAGLNGGGRRGHRDDKRASLLRRGRGFVPAGELGIGTSIVTRAGPSLRLHAAQTKAAGTTVYNLEVEDFHTYFVGKAKLWVHNIDCEPPKAAAEAQRNFILDPNSWSTNTPRPTVAGGLTLEVNGELRSFSGHSAGGQNNWVVDPRVQALYDMVPDNIRMRSTHTKCAEVMILNQIYQNNLEGHLHNGAKSFAVDVKSGEPKKACDSCYYVLKTLLGVEDLARNLDKGG